MKMERKKLSKIEKMILVIADLGLFGLGLLLYADKYSKIPPAKVLDIIQGTLYAGMTYCGASGSLTDIYKRLFKKI